MKSVEEWEEEELRAAAVEYLLDDRTYCLITLRCFVSMSKGRGRKRPYPREITLVKYRKGFHLAKNFQWDIYATEIMGEVEDAEQKLRDAVLGCQNRNLNTPPQPDIATGRAIP